MLQTPNTFVLRLRQGHLLMDGYLRKGKTISKIEKCADLDDEVLQHCKDIDSGRRRKVLGETNDEEQGLIYSEEKLRNEG